MIRQNPKGYRRTWRVRHRVSKQRNWRRFFDLNFSGCCLRDNAKAVTQLNTAAAVEGCVLDVCSAAGAADADGGPTPPVGPVAAGSVLERGAVAWLDAVNAPAPVLVHTNAAGGMTNALVWPVGPQIVALDMAVEPPTERATNGAEALDEPAVLSALDIDRPAYPQLRGAHVAEEHSTDSQHLTDLWRPTELQNPMEQGHPTKMRRPTEQSH